MFLCDSCWWLLLLHLHYYGNFRGLSNTASASGGFPGCCVKGKLRLEAVIEGKDVAQQRLCRYLRGMPSRCLITMYTVQHSIQELRIND